MKDRPIGIYDSGIGGVTVLEALCKRFPRERFVYFADTLNLPYGEKSKIQIIKYSKNIISWFQNKIEAKLVVAACHTSSGIALDKIASNFRIPIVGTMFPLLSCLENNVDYKKVGIIATPASAANHTHAKFLRKHGFQGEIFSISCPNFVPLIEAGQLKGEALSICAKNYLNIFEKQDLDTLIYGCTHYPIIKSIIEEILPTKIKYIDPAEFMAQEVETLLTKSMLLNDISSSLPPHFYCSSNPEAFLAKLQRLRPVHPASVTYENIHASFN